MCSIGEDDFGDEGGLHSMVPELNLGEVLGNKERICRKCNESPSVVKLPYREAQCRGCFLAYVRHKLRASLGAAKGVVRKNAKVLLLHEGNLQSQVMLDIIKFGREEEMFKRLYVDIGGVLFIDDTFLETSLIDRKKLLASLSLSLEYLKMPLLYASVASKKNFCQLSDEIEANEAEENTFRMHLIELKSLTSQQEYVKLIKKGIATNIAESLECQFIFSPEISTDIATKLLTSISVGRGASTSLDVAFLDDRNKILRPLRDLTPLEVHHYLRLNDLKPLNIPSFGQQRDQSASIQNLTAGFINDLQTQFSSTVSTVFKTGDKLKRVKTTEGKSCKMCKAEKDCESSETLFAIEYSKVVSEHVSNSFKNPQEIEEHVEDAVAGVDEFKAGLCYGCRNLFLDISDTTSMEPILQSIR